MSNSEERSRFEKWAKGPHPRGLKFDLTRDLKGRPGYDQSDADAAWEGWQARAALEDRQEAAPMKEGLKDLSVHLLRRFAECQPPYDHDNECWFCGVKEGKQHWHTCSWLTARTIFGINPGVPSEATPSKEFIGTVRRRLFIPVDHEWNGVVREVTAKRESGELVPVTAVLDDLAAFYRKRATLAILKSQLNGDQHCELCGTKWSANESLPCPSCTVGPTKEFVHEDDCDCANDSNTDGNVVEHSEDCKNCTCEKSAAPAPEVQGTPTSISAESASPLQLAAESTAPVGTPQKETPPMPPQSSCKKCGLQMARITVGMVYRCLNCEPLPFPPKETPPDAVKMRIAQYKARIPCGNCGHVHLGSCSRCDPPGCEQIVPPTAPVPEVQGTPTKSNVAHQPWCASAPRPMDVPMGRGPYPCDCGAVKAAPAPVGTPQKETPPAKCPYCDFNEGLGHAKFCRNYQVTRGSSMPYGADAQNFGAVPEGVQGKEPQTPEDFPLWERACDCCRIDGAPILADSGKWIHCYDDDQANEPCVAGSVFALGEAAGRRSAITEMQERAEQKHKYERDIRAAIVYRDVLAWCADLLEKTKP